MVGAGYSISEDAGDTAILIKLIRVFMLVPVLFFFAMFYRKHVDTSSSNRALLPPFLIGFIILVTLNSMHLLQADIAKLLENASKWMLVMAITAVGMKTSLKEVFSLGWKPIALIVMETVSITALYFLVLALDII